MTREVATMWEDIIEDAKAVLVTGSLHGGFFEVWAVQRDGTVFTTARECFREALLDAGVGWSSEGSI